MLRVAFIYFLFSFCSLYFFLHSCGLLNHVFRISFWFIYSVFECTFLYSFSVAALGSTLYIHNLSQSSGVIILPVRVKYRNLTSFISLYSFTSFFPFIIFLHPFYLIAILLGWVCWWQILLLFLHLRMSCLSISKEYFC